MEQPHIPRPEAKPKPKKKPANRRSRRTVAAGAIPPTLPPSVEEAYRKKCIELKRRMGEVEQNNDSFRLRKNRLLRGIRKMRLERSFLLHELGKRMRKNGANGYWDEESEGSSEGPPTVCYYLHSILTMARHLIRYTNPDRYQPNDKPLRSKRSHRRPAATPPPLAQQLSEPNAEHHQHHNPNFQPPYAPNREFSFSMVPTPNGAPHVAPQPTGYSINDLYPSEASQIPFSLNVQDYFIQKTYMENRDPALEGLTQEQLVQSGIHVFNSMPTHRIEEWEDSYREQLGHWREAMHDMSRETGNAPLGVIKTRQQEGDRQAYARGGYDEGPHEDGAADAEDSAAASGGFTAVNG